MTSNELLPQLTDVMAGLMASFDLHMAFQSAGRARHECMLANATTGVHVLFDRLDNVVLVSIYRLHDTPSPDMLTLDRRIADPLNGFDLLDLLAVRAPHVAITPTVDRRHVHNSLRLVLSEYENALTLYARDVLNGDFAVFDQVADIVATRITHEITSGRAIGPDGVSFMEAYEQDRQQ